MPSRDSWCTEGAELTSRLAGLVPVGVAFEHIGSTSVPGLAAKDCIDVMVVVADLMAPEIGSAMRDAGFRERPEPWNHNEVTYGWTFPKRVFAPPMGARSCNVHVRLAGGANVRYALLFRDFLRAHAHQAAAWGRFKTELAASVPDLMRYGQIKAPALDVLMFAAETWAGETCWMPTA